MREKRNIKLWAVIIWLAIWEIGALVVRQEIFLVSPIKALFRFFSLAVTGEFWLGVISSCGRIAAGLLLAIFLGALFATLSKKNKWVRDLLLPIMVAIKAVPVASFVILALICFSSKYLSVFISFLIVFPIIYENIFTGINETNKSLLEMAEVFNLSQEKKRRYIYWPSVYPYAVSALRTAIGMAWKAGIAAEVIGTPNESIGAKLYQAKIYLETADLIAWTIGIILLSLIMEKILIWILSRADIALKRVPLDKTENRHAAPTNTHNAVQKMADISDMQNRQSETVSAGMQHAVQSSVDIANIQKETSVTVPTITLKNISKSFNNKKVLDNVSLDFPAGKISVIMASSGAGKTTLLRIIAGFERLDSGSISVNYNSLINENIPTDGIASTDGASREAQISMVFQEDRLLDYMTAEENIKLVNDKLSREEIIMSMERVGLNIERVGLGVGRGAAEGRGYSDAHEFNKKVSAYSGGMKRRVAILRALLADSAILLLDEPFKGLDDDTKSQVISYIREKAEGKTVLLVTHDEEDIRLIGADNVIKLI